MRKMLVIKEPSWMIKLGILLLFPGMFALIPFKVEAVQMLDLPFYVLFSLGVLLLFAAGTKVGWWLSLEDNVLYYSKFTVFSTWKRRRSSEFALSLTKISSISREKGNLVVVYHPSKRISFNTLGLDKKTSEDLDTLIKEVSSKLA